MPPFSIEQNQNLLRALGELLSTTLTTDSLSEISERLLETFLEVTESQFGFIGEVIEHQGKPVLQAHAITNIAWNEETRRFYREHAPRGMQFTNLQTLFGFTIRTRQPLISNDPLQHPASGGLPEGHPPLTSYLGLPLFAGDKLVGMVGIANRSGGYDPDWPTHLEPLAQAAGHVVQAARLQREQTHLKRTEQLQRAIRLSFFDQTQDGVLVVSRAGEVLEANQRFLQQWSLSEAHRQVSRVSELLEVIRPQVLSPTEAQLLLQAHDAEFDACQSRTLLLTDDRACEWYARPLIDEAGQILGKASYFRDITNQQRQTRQLLQAKQAAEAANLAKSAFLANMSHEIRTPLTSILGFSDLLLEEADDTQSKDFLQIVKRNGEHLLQVINDILDLSKIEAGHVELSKSMFSLQQLANEVVGLLQAKAEAKALRLETYLAADLPDLIETDPLRLKQILLNLIGNAIKFTQDGFVRVRVTIEAQNCSEATQSFGRGAGTPCCLIQVVDSGIGMTTEQLTRVFDSFVQADSSTTRQFGGTGLGLTISRRLCEALGGTLQAESTPGRGSIFTCCFPLETFVPGLPPTKRPHAEQPLAGSAE